MTKKLKDFITEGKSSDDDENPDTTALHTHLKSLGARHRHTGMDDYSHYHYNHQSGMDHDKVKAGLDKSGFKHIGSASTKHGTIHHYERFTNFGEDKPAPTDAEGSEWHTADVHHNSTTGKVHKVKVTSTNADNSDH